MNNTVCYFLTFIETLIELKKQNKEFNMTNKEKLGLVVIGAVAAAGLAYCAYSHKEEIYVKIEDLKNEIAKKKTALGEVGREKISHIAHSLIAVIEKYADSNNELTLKARDVEIEMLKKELFELSK